MSQDAPDVSLPVSSVTPASDETRITEGTETPSSPGAQEPALISHPHRHSSEQNTPQNLARINSLENGEAQKSHREPQSRDTETGPRIEQPLSSHSSDISNIKRGDPRDPDNPHSHVPTLDGLSEDMSRPPPIGYTLRTRKFAIAFFWTLILIDCIAIPLVLYFCLHYLTNLSPNTVFSISTACLGGVSVVEYFLRFWRLWKKGSNCRVIGARRWYLDWFHWNFSIAWVFIMVELIVGTVPKFPPIRLLAMPVSSLLFWFAFELLAIDTFRFFHIPAPIRISSVPKGAPMRPAIYSIIEDVCAVDGSGGTEFRKRFNARFVASHYFRQMLHRLTIFWAFGGLACAIVTTTLVFTLANNEIAYIIGWALPFVWVAFMIPPTFWYVFRCLRREYAKWPERRTSV